MKIRQTKPFKSISGIDDQDLPQFTLITGINGAGKTQFLEAIQEGAIHRDPRSGVVLYNSNDFRHNFPEPYDPEPDRRAWAHHKPSILRAAGVAKAYFDQYKDRVAPEKLQEEIGDITRPYLQDMANTTDFLTDLGGLKAHLGKELWDLTEQDLMLPIGQRFRLVDDISRIFVNYVDRVEANNYAIFQNLRYGKNLTSIPEDEFDRLAGPPPWTLLNEQLSSMDLPYSVIPPVPGSGPYQVMLQHNSLPVQISPRDLSSGEKTLLQLAISGYGFGMTPSQGALLMLDEVDAFLHPRMIQTYLDTIQKALIGRLGMSVIATTHSATTVALAPEESLYLLSGTPRKLTKIGTDAALAALTVGVPSLAIDASGRRQVFVESNIDAEIYADVYRFLRTQLPPGRSLEFIGTGKNGKNEGCAQVKLLVQNLRNAGNKSVFGLIDSDKGENQPEDRIFILSNGRRDGIENVLLDPLLVAGLICHSFPECLERLDLPRDFRFEDLLKLDKEGLQQIAHTVCALTFRGKATQIVTSKYLSGLELEIDARCFTTDDHDYESLVQAAFPPFQRYHKTGDLLKAVAGMVIREKLEVTPLDLLETLSALVGDA